MVAWKHYLTQQYPHVHVVGFTSFPRDFNQQQKEGIQSKRKKRRFHAVGSMDLLQTCEQIVEDKGTLSIFTLAVCVAVSRRGSPQKSLLLNF